MFDTLLHLLQRVGFTTITINLCPAGNPRLDLVSLHVGLDQILVVLVVRQGVGPGPDNGHAPLQDIEELRQLVEAGPTDESANGSDPGIILGSLGHAALMLLVHDHGTELVHLETLAIDAGAVLLEHHRPR